MARANASGSLTVICKVAHGRRNVDRLKLETDIYVRNLRDLQGSVVPNMLGCFTGQTQEGWDVGVLLLEDWGRALGWPLYSYSLSIRAKVLHALVAIHRAGVRHGDFKPRNILAKKRADGNFAIRIIDFDRAQTPHECSYRPVDPRFTFYENPPDVSEFGCYELYDACENAELWFNTYIYWNGQSRSIEHLADPVLAVQSFGCPENMEEQEAIATMTIHMKSIRETWEKRKKMDENPMVPG
ncbi:hypothetical protein FKP32DRAFT_1641030 [Trametes sanguinea]|nr:hypothetical protein FKP32DRAFT_1641030 [Trametes sanguinea]